MSTVLRVYLSAEDRQRLRKLTHSGKTPARMITRAQILLLVDRNQPNWKKHREVVDALQTSLARISRVSRRYVRGGLDAALSEEPRSGTPPKMTGEVEAQLILLACSHPPEGRKRWTLRLLAEQMVLLGHIPSLSNVTVHQRLKKMRSNPGR
jgi:transposase